MKVQLDHEDMASIMRSVRDDVGAYLAAREAEKNVWKHPWASNGAYTEAIFKAVAEYYEKKAEGEKDV